jgi:hypothetical protein
MSRILYVSHDIEQPRGGIGVLYDHVAILRAHGFEAFVAHAKPGFRYPFAPTDIPVLDVASRQAVLDSDVVVLPEDYAEAIRGSRDLACRKVLFCQNHFFIFDGLLPGETWSDFGFSAYMCVSSPIQNALSKWFGVNASIVRPAVDEAFFAERSKPLEAPITIACMPRKGRGTLRLVRGLLAAKGHAKASAMSWLEIEGLPKDQVAARLGTAQIYVSTSVREGLGLPPLEAMASGCLVVGFTGAGGLDFANRDNGVWVPDEDSWALAAALESTLASLHDPTAIAVLEAKRKAGRTTAERYTREQLERDVIAFWSTYFRHA